MTEAPPGRSVSWQVVSSQLGTAWDYELGMNVTGHVIRFRTGTGLPGLVVIPQSAYTAQRVADKIGAQGAMIERASPGWRAEYFAHIGAYAPGSPWGGE